MNFNDAYEAWLEKHKKARSGERLRRLEKGHGHAEKELLERILWPVLGTLDDLHPEYEVVHFNGKRYYNDIALVRSLLWVDFEADGFSSHVTNMDRGKFCLEKRRDAQLQLAGWRVVRIAYDDIEDQAEQWQQAIRGLLQLWTAEVRDAEGLNGNEKEVERLARKKNRICVGDVCALLGVCERTARNYLKELQRKKVLVPEIYGRTRTHYYKLSPDRRLFL